MILRLSNEQKKKYDLIYEGVRKGEYRIGLPFAYVKDDAVFLVKLVLSDLTDRINYNNCSVSLCISGMRTVLELKPVFTGVEAVTAQRRFEEETNRVMGSIIKPGSNTIQKALAIHDYLAKTVTYDECGNGCSDIISHTAYGALVNKTAVCEGVSYAFCHLAKRAGINATVVSGIADNGEHSWNMINIGTDYCHMDVTWDLNSKNGDGNAVSYDYFALCDGDLRGRKWNRDIYPPSAASRYDYFTVTSSFAHSREQLRSIMLRQYKKYKRLYFKYDFLNLDRKEATDYFWKELLSVARENGLFIGSVTTSLNTEQRIFRLY